MATGALLDVERGDWQDLPDSPLPAMRNPAGVWTDEGVFVCCGRTPRGGRTAAAVYSVDARHWTEVPAPPVSGSYNPTAVWTGGEVLVLLGSPSSELLSYQPDTRQWRRLARPPEESPSGYEAVWAGTKLVAWARFTGSGSGPLAHDPAADTWSRLGASAPAIDTPSLVWTGSSVVAWGVDPSWSVTVGGVWSEREGWRLLPPAPLPPVEGGEWTPGSQSMVWGDGVLLVWVGELDDEPLDSEIRMLTLEPATGQWTEFAPFRWGKIGDTTLADLAWTSGGLVALTSVGDYVYAHSELTVTG